MTKTIMTFAALLTSLAGTAAWAQEIHDDTVLTCEEQAVEFELADCQAFSGPNESYTGLFMDYSDDLSTLTITQFDVDGNVLDVSDPIEIEGTPHVPSFRDINSDGREELFIPLLTGNVNTSYFVWQRDDEGVFYPSDWVSAGSVDGIEVRDNMSIATTRGNAATYYERAQLLDADGFVLAYEMEVNFADRTCVFTDESGIVAVGLDRDAVLAECMEREWE